MKLMLVAVAASGLSWAGYSFFRPPALPRTYHSSSCAFTAPVDASEAERSAFMVAFAKNEPLPEGWSITNQTTIDAIDTGVVQPSGERLWIVTLEGNTSEVSNANAYVDSRYVFHATRENGAVVDQDGKSVATLPVLLPPPGEEWTAKVEWLDECGSVQTSSAISTSR
jgi:hypothetical protein